MGQNFHGVILAVVDVQGMALLPQISGHIGTLGVASRGKVGPECSKEKTRTNNKLHPQVTSGQGFKPGHQTLSALSHLCSPTISRSVTAAKQT